MFSKIGDLSCKSRGPAQKIIVYVLKKYSQLKYRALSSHNIKFAFLSSRISKKNRVFYITSHF